MHTKLPERVERGQLAKAEKRARNAVAKLRALRTIYEGQQRKCLGCGVELPQGSKGRPRERCAACVIEWNRQMKREWAERQKGDRNGTD